MSRFSSLVESSLVPLRSKTIRLTTDNIMSVVKPGGYIYWEGDEEERWSVYHVIRMHNDIQWWVTLVAKKDNDDDLGANGGIGIAQVSRDSWRYFYCDKDPRSFTDFQSKVSELKHGRVTQNRDPKYYNIDKDKIKGVRAGVGIERGDDRKFRASVVAKEPGGHRTLKKLPARFDDRTRAKDFAAKASQTLGVKYFGSVGTTRPKK